MKKIILIALCLFVALTVVACGNDTAETKESATKASTEKITEEKTSEEKTSNVETEAPTEQPTEPPTEAPTEQPTEAPTEHPTEQQTEEPVVRPTDGPDIAGAPDIYKKLYYFDSYEKFRDSFLNFDENTLSHLFELDQTYLYSLSKNSYVSEDEIKNGIFGNFRKNIIENDRIMIPYVDGKVSFENYPGRQPIVLFSSFESSLKPTIRYGAENRVGIHTTYIDRFLIEEAAEKGPSWLRSVLDPNALNVENQTDRLSEEDKKYLSIYEKECSLGDRQVKVMLMEHLYLGTTKLYAYFLYDDMWIYISGEKELVEELLPKLSFYECEFSTGKPLRDTPGRTADYLAEK